MPSLVVMVRGVRTKLLVAVGAVALVALVAVGCGSGDGGADSSEASSRDHRPTTQTRVGTGAAPAACELITETDAAAAFGEPVTAGTQSRDECWWFSANDLKTVNVIRRTDDVATWRAGYQNDFWVPNQLGDEGYTGKALTSVVFRIGATQYEINVVYSTRGDPAKVARGLAATVVSRL